LYNICNAKHVNKSKRKMNTVPVEPIKKRKSVHLTRQEIAGLKKYRKGFHTETECAISLGIDRNVLNRILIVGSGAPESIERIRQVLSLN
jgi:hypothetical protein